MLCCRSACACDRYSCTRKLQTKAIEHLRSLKKKRNIVPLGDPTIEHVDVANFPMFSSIRKPRTYGKRVLLRHLGVHQNQGRAVCFSPFEESVCGTSGSYSCTAQLSPPWSTSPHVTTDPSFGIAAKAPTEAWICSTSRS